MARVAVEIPKIGLVMETVRIVRWLKAAGDAVKAGEPLLEVETEKSVVEIEAALAGRLVQILAPAGQEAKVGDRVAWMDAEQPTPTLPVPTEALRRDPAGPRAAPSKKEIPGGERIRSSPAARRLIAERGLDLRAITGSGPGGRVQLDDVLRSVDTAGAAGLPRPAPAAAAAGMSPMQRALARAMSLSNATVPQFTVERALDCSALNAARAGYDAAAPPDSAKLSVNDFLLQAVARALIEIPAMNVVYAGNEDLSDARIVPASGTHVGLVVAIEGGLLVPVFHDADQLGLRELARRRRQCVKRALAGRLKREELTGATFSVSNLGARGPDRFAAMINPPESAILAVGRQRDCVVARSGGFAVRPVSDLTLTVDHRVANGRLAAEFLARLVEILEARDWQL